MPSATYLVATALLVLPSPPLLLPLDFATRASASAAKPGHAQRLRLLWRQPPISRPALNSSHWSTLPHGKRVLRLVHLTRSTVIGGEVRSRRVGGAATPPPAPPA